MMRASAANFNNSVKKSPRFSSDMGTLYVSSPNVQAIWETWYDSADMEWTIVGLGNPGKEYEGTRHNIGRDILMALARKEGIREWKEEKKPRMETAKGVFHACKARFILPNTYMNDSGLAVKGFIKTKKDLEKLIVLQDDLDLPLGKVKI